MFFSSNIYQKIKVVKSNNPPSQSSRIQKKVLIKKRFPKKNAGKHAMQKSSQRAQEASRWIELLAVSNDNCSE